jgi:deoxyadenosine/deoxycytidine kinase
MSDPRLVIVEGPIGVGKSSLARLLSEELGGRLVLEKVEENPFLVRFYEDPAKFAFQTQLFFLLSRFRQLEALRQEELFSRATVCDYFFPKDRLFAQLTLTDEELALYDQVYSLLNPKLPHPDLVVYLSASTTVLMNRIRQRGRAYEKTIDFEYLETLNDAYNRFFFQFEESPLLVVSTTEIDFVHRRSDLDDLVRQIRSQKTGRVYYNPVK